MYLGAYPGVFEALCSGGSFLRHYLQHGLQERAELDGFFPGPLVLIQQDLDQTPRLQLRNVPQVAFKGLERQKKS